MMMNSKGIWFVLAFGISFFITFLPIYTDYDDLYELLFPSCSMGFEDPDDGNSSICQDEPSIFLPGAALFEISLLKADLIEQYHLFLYEPISHSQCMSILRC